MKTWKTSWSDFRRSGLNFKNQNLETDSLRGQPVSLSIKFHTRLHISDEFPVRNRSGAFLRPYRRNLLFFHHNICPSGISKKSEANRDNLKLSMNSYSIWILTESQENPYCNWVSNDFTLFLVLYVFLHLDWLSIPWRPECIPPVLWSICGRMWRF